MLSQEQINTIEAKTNTILETVFGNAVDLSIPISLEKILKHYGISVKSGEFEDDNISGAFERDVKTIYIADDEPLNRRAFTVAHELGHVFLHEDTKNEVFLRSQILNLPEESRKEEQEANWFAAALLIPEKQLRHYYSLTKDLGDLAIVFGVSSTAVYFRLKNLEMTL